MPVITVNGAELYHEVRGAGPPVLLIMGATGDAGHFETFGGLLADEFTVVSYDRRGNGRSPRPAGWATTSPQEQAEDAAALLQALDLPPAAIFGTSSGANFALCLAVTHPELVRGAVLHEPVLGRLYDDPGTGAAIKAALETTLSAGGPHVALEQFWRLVAGDAGWERLDPELRARMLVTATTFLTIELGTFEHYLPDEPTLSAPLRPQLIVLSDGGRPGPAQAAGRLAAEVVRTPGTHTAYHDHPHELAETIRPFLRDVSAPHG